jgi:hypothetical protein
MKRDARLRVLSSEHHHALVLARRASRGELSLADAQRAFDEDLAPHFAVEESLLLPPLCAAGRPDLAERTLREHDRIRDALSRSEIGEFGRLLTEHVRFEERELFPACEMLLAASVLEAVAVGAR